MFNFGFLIFAQCLKVEFSIGIGEGGQENIDSTIDVAENFTLSVIHLEIKTILNVSQQYKAIGTSNFIKICRNISA